MIYFVGNNSRDADKCTPIMENQMAKNMDKEIATGFMQWLRHNIQGLTPLTKGSAWEIEMVVVRVIIVKRSNTNGDRNSNSNRHRNSLGKAFTCNGFLVLGGSCKWKSGCGILRFQTWVEQELCIPEP